MEVRLTERLHIVAHISQGPANRLAKALGIILFLYCFAGMANAQNAVSAVLGGEISRGYEAASEVNVRDRGAVSAVRVGDQPAVRLRLDYAWAGGDLDWRRLGEPGFAQRIQFRESPRNRMRAGREYWYHTRFMIPATMPRVRNHSLSLFDFKHHIGPAGSVPTVSLVILPDPSGVHIIEGLNSRWTCGSYRNANGGRSDACDMTETVARLGSQADYSNRWVDVVSHARWSNDDGGFFRMWIDGRAIFGFAGDTLQGTSEVEHKFGLDRHHMNGDPGMAEAYFANVSRTETCEALGDVDCAQLQTITRNGFSNVGRQFRIAKPDYSDNR